MNVWLLSTDFFFSSQLQGQVQRLGLTLHQVADSETLLEKLAAISSDETISPIVLVDLSVPQLDLSFISQLRNGYHSPTAIIAYGPHVADGKLAAAKAAGCDQVLTRGQAHRDIAMVLGQYL